MMPPVVLANAETLREETTTLEVIAKVYVVAILAAIAISFVLGLLLQKTDLEILLIISVAVNAMSAIALAITLRLIKEVRE
jgi:uncharacterized membrane protein YozB (DUF420 family)